MSTRGEFLDTSKVKRDDLIYLAGLIDGDGCFFISTKKNQNKTNVIVYMLKLQIHCINETFIDNLMKTFGGVKVTYRRKAPRNWLYGVEFTGNLLTDLCKRLIPFLRLKKNNAINMLEMRRTYNGRGGNIIVSDEVLAIRAKCYAISRSINTHKPLKVLPPCLPSATQLGGPSQSEKIF